MEKVQEAHLYNWLEAIERNVQNYNALV